MKRARVSTACLAALIMLGGQAQRAAGETLAGVSMPAAMTVEGTLLHLNGMGVRSFTFMRIHGFVAGLYVPVPMHDAAALIAAPGPKLLRIEFVHGASLGRVREELRDMRGRACVQACPKQDEADFARLIAIARPVRPGDVTTYVYGADGKVRVLFDDTEVAAFQNADFARRSLTSVIGANPPTVALRTGLLGG